MTSAGPGNPYSAVTGYPYVKAITDLMVAGPNGTTDGNFTPPPLIMSFTVSGFCTVILALR